MGAPSRVWVSVRLPSKVSRILKLPNSGASSGLTWGQQLLSYRTGPAVPRGLTLTPQAPPPRAKGATCAPPRAARTATNFEA